MADKSTDVQASGHEGRTSFLWAQAMITLENINNIEDLTTDARLVVKDGEGQRIVDFASYGATSKSVAQAFRLVTFQIVDERQKLYRQLLMSDYNWTEEDLNDSLASYREVVAEVSKTG